MIAAAILAAAAALCAAGENTIALEAPGQARAGLPDGASVPEGVGALGESRVQSLGAPGKILDRTQGRPADPRPTFQAEQPEGEPEGLRARPHSLKGDAQYKPKVRLGPDMEQPAVEEIRREIDRRLQEDASKQR